MSPGDAPAVALTLSLHTGVPEQAVCHTHTSPLAARVTCQVAGRASTLRALPGPASPDTPASEPHSPVSPIAWQIEPLSGPLDGGTRLTIRGRNLGRRFSDVAQGVWIGSVACEPLADRYTVSEE